MITACSVAVEQTVVLPDGSSHNALAPQLYVRVQPGDIDGSEALLSAEATGPTT